MLKTLSSLLLITATVLINSQNAEAFDAENEELTFSKIIATNGMVGIEKCIEKIGCIVQERENFTSMKDNMACSLASSIYFDKRIGNDIDQLTPSEFAELLDKTGYKPDNAVFPQFDREWPFEESTFANAFFTLSRQYGYKIPNLSKIKNILTNNSDYTTVVHGGSYNTIRQFLNQKSAPEITYDDSNNMYQSIWVLPANEENHKMFSRAPEYAEKAYLFFDQPTVLIADVESQYLKTTQNQSYEKLLPLEGVPYLKNIKLYKVDVFKKIEYPFGQINSDSTANYIHRLPNLTPLLAQKLSSWKMH